MTEKVRKNPYSVILFDEVEKAHPDIMNILLQILDDGRLTDSQGRTVDFKNTVIIMTSNIGARLITDKKSIGFENQSNNESDYKNLKNDVLNETKKFFKPELLNRIDEIIVFHKLRYQDLREITNIMLERVINRVKKQGINIEISNEAREVVATKGTDYKYGARPLRRTIQNLIEDKIAEKLLESSFSNPEEKLLVDSENDEIVVKALQ